MQKYKQQQQQYNLHKLYKQFVTIHSIRYKEVLFELNGSTNSGLS